MYFSKFCRFTKAIRSFSSTVEISLEATKSSPHPWFEFLLAFCTSIVPKQPPSLTPDITPTGLEAFQSLTHNRNVATQTGAVANTFACAYMSVWGLN